MSKKSYSEFYDRIPYIILKAPDRFPTDYEMNLEIAFSQLNEDLAESKKELGEFFEQVKSKIDESLSFYREGDIRSGIKSLQWVDNLIRENGLAP